MVYTGFSAVSLASAEVETVAAPMFRSRVPV
jgi:hypothetical protein